MATVASDAPDTIENTAGIDPPDDGLCIDGGAGPCEAEALIETEEAPLPATPAPTMTPDPFDDAPAATRTATPTPTPTVTSTPSPTATVDGEGEVAGITPPRTGDGGLLAWADGP
jgi:hypothetical protein